MHSPDTPIRLPERSRVAAARQTAILMTVMPLELPTALAAPLGLRVTDNVPLLTTPQHYPQYPAATDFRAERLHPIDFLPNRRD